MASFRSWRRVARLTPDALGWSAKAANAAVTGSSFDATGADGLTVFVHFTRVAATGTIALSVQAYDEVVEAWTTLQTVAVASGTATLSAMSVDKATGSASQAYEVRLTELRFHKMRINMAAAVTAAGATDLISISAELTAQGG